VLGLLSDGEFHSGTSMGNILGVSRAAINKAIKSLSDIGIDVHRVSGRGYRLVEPMQPLEKHSIARHLSPHCEKYIDKLHLIDEVDSTSNFLSTNTSCESVQGSICVAEAQLSGRGRRGRSWVSTPYSNIMMSMSWQFERGPASLAGLSLAAGVAVINALEVSGVRNVGLKWPNDILWNSRKLAGLLVDVQGEAAGPSRVILGLGLNVMIGEKDAKRIDQPWVDVKTILDQVIDRNQLVASLINQLDDMFNRFDTAGLGAFEQDWLEAHVFHGKTVNLLHGDEKLVGVVEGIDASGAIKLRDTSGQVNHYHSGEVSLRAVGIESSD